MEDNQTSNEYQYDPEPSNTVLLVALVILAAVMVTGFVLLYSHVPTQQVDQSTKAQAELQTESIRLRIAQENNGDNMRMKVIESCVAAHMIPILLNGNIDCKRIDPK